jgi:ketosteroid isomerase-like protein
MEISNAEVNVEIQSLVESYKVSVFDKHLEGYLSIFEKDIRVFDMWKDWSCDGIQSWRKVTEEWFSSLEEARVSVEFGEPSESVFKDSAVFTAFVKFAALNLEGQVLRHHQERLTWALRRNNGQWKVFHAHTSSPTDPSTLRPILEISK